MPGIVVGVDGSDHSRHALAWAMREAEMRHVPLQVLTVHPPPVRPATRIYWGIPSFPDNSFDPEEAQAATQQFVDSVAQEVDGAVPQASVSVVTGDASEELVNASYGADLLVVGTRGGGGFARLLMGSVSSQVTAHAVCPVVVIPQPR